MSNIIGIDLGTSTTLLAHLSNSGEPRIYKNKDNEDYTDSAVWFENENKVVIGNPAKQMLGVAEDDKVFIEYKRDMGDPSVVHTVYGKEWRPRNFSALVLKQIKEQFEKKINPNVKEEIIPEEIKNLNLKDIEANFNTNKNINIDEITNNIITPTGKKNETKTT